jgi:hypothetical protein
MELEDRWKLLWNTASQDDAERYSNEVLDDLDATRITWAARRAEMLKHRIDVGAWMVDEVRSFLS